MLLLFLPLLLLCMFLLMLIPMLMTTTSTTILTTMTTMMMMIAPDCVWGARLDDEVLCGFVTHVCAAPIHNPRSTLIMG